MGKILDNLSLFGTVITFLIFLFTLPYWARKRWLISDIWRYWGINIKELKYNLKYTFNLFLIGLFIIIFILLTLFIGKWAYIDFNINIDTFLNAILLAIGVGFAEELIFRGWLIEELRLINHNKNYLYIQAIIFGVIHINFNNNISSNVALVFGISLYGYLLGLSRYRSNSLLPPIVLHGSMVGIWFFVNHSLISFKSNIPVWLLGSLNGKVLNPMEGLIGIVLLMVSIYYYKYSDKLIYIK
tara:strand:- start:3468 stop:4193 length:726 start_codon:yes stop_codon:yes gene_type:complete